MTRIKHYSQTAMMVAAIVAVILLLAGCYSTEKAAEDGRSSISSTLYFTPTASSVTPNILLESRPPNTPTAAIDEEEKNDSQTIYPEITKLLVGTPELTITPQTTPSFPSTSIPPTFEITEQIFLYFRAFGFRYVSLDPFLDVYRLMEASWFGIEDAVQGASTDLAFANHSNQIAFWIRNPGEKGSFWLADISLSEVKQVFSDEEEIYISDTQYPPQDVTVEWFPNDKYIVVRPTNQDLSPIIINAETLDFEEWLWNCDTVIISPETSNLAWFCSNLDSDSMIVEWNGDLWVPMGVPFTVLWEERFPDDEIAWSPQGDHIAYISPEASNILEITSLQEKRSIELDADKLFPESIRWSTNGERILVQGYNAESYYDWFVLDSNTSDLIWNLGSNYEPGPGSPLDLRLTEGSISSDGSYVVLASNRLDVPSGNQMLLFNVNENSFEGIVADVGHGASNFAWGH